MNASQAEVFEVVAKGCVINSLDGYNSTVFAYGQTGSGKTYTMSGGVDRFEDRGIIPRALSLVFQELERRADAQYTVHVSFLELYQDKGFDLLDAGHAAEARQNTASCHAHNPSFRLVRSLQGPDVAPRVQGQTDQISLRHLCVRRRKQTVIAPQL